MCTKSDFVPVDFTGVRWLEQESDYPLAKQYWKAFDQDLDDITWSKAHEYGDRYAAFLEDGQIISIAAVCYLSDKAWEVAAVSTLKSHRRKGYSKRVLSFIMAYILEMGRLATCCTNEDNVAMTATAKSVGFKEVPAIRPGGRSKDYFPKETRKSNSNNHHSVYSITDSSIQDGFNS